MNTGKPLSEPSLVKAIAVTGIDRWEVYRRLQDLDIPCQCSTDRPLQIEISSPIAAIQVWSVVRQIATPRQELVEWLEGCWQIQTKTEDR